MRLPVAQLALVTWKNKNFNTAAARPRCPQSDLLLDRTRIRRSQAQVQVLGDPDRDCRARRRSGWSRRRPPASRSGTSRRSPRRASTWTCPKWSCGGCSMRRTRTATASFRCASSRRLRRTRPCSCDWSGEFATTAARTTLVTARTAGAATRSSTWTCSKYDFQQSTEENYA